MVVLAALLIDFVHARRTLCKEELTAQKQLMTEVPFASLPREASMLTLFSIPKPFVGRTATLQSNAIRSWTLLRPTCEIILFGDDEGTAEVASRFGVRHCAKIQCNEYGTPLVNDLFARAQALAGNDLLCYVNADMILMSDFMCALAQTFHHKRRCLMVGRRWNVSLNEAWDFRRPDWESALRHYTRLNGTLFSKYAIDYFVFPKGLFGRIPPFAIGRGRYDNWLVYQARQRLAAVVDATEVVTAVHQNHDYGRFGTLEGRRKSHEAEHNRALMPGRLFGLGDATHVLQPGGLHVTPRLSDLDRLAGLFPSCWLPIRAFKAVLVASRPVRSALGLTSSALLGRKP